MLLRNFDIAQKYFDYSQNREINDTSNPKIKGWYKYINNNLSALLVKDNQLDFIYGDNMIRISSSHQVLLATKAANTSEFILLDGSEVLIKFSFTSPSFRFNFPPFEYLDDEDSSWEEYVTRVINDKQRQEKFVKNLKE